MKRPIDFVIRAGQPLAVDALREYAERRLSFALRRYQDRVAHVTVRLVDQNGPRRGVDARCSMTAELVDGHRIFVDATTAWPFTSITRAADRLHHAVSRQSERRASACRTRSAEPGRDDGKGNARSDASKRNGRFRMKGRTASFFARA